ncbi:hypothetical protein Rhopal_000296-T1 [Rhodotorula paludigena]|uniref:t-SNARE coiled-coil homology domain-containing protein n=1 Tax=Rhodotorula paludigena TaxID=86838 RepID=A0AAV5GDD8_9BASI|nr:hypothetical protein Rhopal_000296-T1 [Rhodotorula paludigena]
MDSSVFAEYETDLVQLLKGVEDKLKGEAVTLRGDQRKSLFRRIERELEEADEIIEQMELEAQTADVDKAELQGKLRTHKATLARHKQDLKSLAAGADRDDLLSVGGSSRADHTAIEMGRADSPSFSQAQAQRSQLLSASDKLADGQRRLEESQRLALETEDVGAGILRDLRGQRDVLEHTRDTLYEADGSIDRASGTLRKMVRRAYQQRAVTYAIIALLVLLMNDRTVSATALHFLLPLLVLAALSFVFFLHFAAKLALETVMGSFQGEYVDEKAVVEHVDNIAAASAQIDRKAEKRLLRKLDLIILPQVTLLFLLNFIDREYNIALMVFYIFYIIGEVPSNLVLKKVGSRWLSFLCMAFGAVTIGSAWVHNFGTFLGVRILLGIFEGGVIPGIAFLLTRFYTRQVSSISAKRMAMPRWPRLSELAFRVGVFLSLGPGLSGAFGGLLAAGFLNADFPGLRTWQKIFVCEGIITVGYGIISFFIIPTSPETVRWLTPEERALALRRLDIEHLGQTDEKTTVRGVFKALCNPFTWLCTLAYGFINVIVQGTSLFLPTIINGKTRRHGLCIALSSILSVVGYIMFLASDNPKVLYGASFLTFTGALPCGPFFLAWATANAGSPTARAVAAATVPAWGSWGSMVCTWLYLPKYRPRYIPGNSFNLAASLSAITLALCLMFYCIWENKQREAGKRDHRLEGLTEEQARALGHRHPSYRLMI